MILLSTLNVIRRFICTNKLELASEIESDLQDTVDWGGKWLVNFNARKTQLVPFDQSNNTGTIDAKVDGSFLEEKTCFKMLELIFSSRLDWDFYIISIAKTASKKIEVLSGSLKFLSPEDALYLFKSIIWRAWNTVVMSGLVLVVATENC